MPTAVAFPSYWTNWRIFTIYVVSIMILISSSEHAAGTVSGALIPEKGRCDLSIWIWVAINTAVMIAGVSFIRITSYYETPLMLLIFILIALSITCEVVFLNLPGACVNAIFNRLLGGASTLHVFAATLSWNVPIDKISVMNSQLESAEYLVNTLTTSFVTKFLANDTLSKSANRIGPQFPEGRNNRTLTHKQSLEKVKEAKRFHISFLALKTSCFAMLLLIWFIVWNYPEFMDPPFAISISESPYIGIQDALEPLSTSEKMIVFANVLCNVTDIILTDSYVTYHIVGRNISVSNYENPGFFLQRLGGCLVSGAIFILMNITVYYLKEHQIQRAMIIVYNISGVLILTLLGLNSAKMMPKGLSTPGYTVLYGLLITTSQVFITARLGHVENYKLNLAAAEMCIAGFCFGILFIDAGIPLIDVMVCFYLVIVLVSISSSVIAWCYEGVRTSTLSKRQSLRETMKLKNKEKQEREINPIRSLTSA